MKTLIAFIFLVFFTSSALAEPPRARDMDTDPLFIRDKDNWPFRFSQVVNGLRKMVERDCGYCTFYDFGSPLPKESAHPFILLEKSILDRYGWLLSIYISCPALTGINGILAVDFDAGLHGDFSFYRAYEISPKTSFEGEDAEKMMAYSLFKKVEEYYGWDEKLDTKYDDYIIDLSVLNEFSGRFIWRENEELLHDNALSFGTSSFENERYFGLIYTTRLFQNSETGSYIFYTNTNSPGYIADKDLREAQDHLISLTTDDGQVILRFNFAASGRLKEPVSLVFKPNPERKTMKLSKVLLGEEEIDPNAAGLRKFWERLAQYLEKIKYLG